MMPHRARLTLRDPIIANSRSAPHFNRGATKLLPESLPFLGQQLLLRRRHCQHQIADRVRERAEQAAVSSACGGKHCERNKIRLAADLCL